MLKAFERPLKDFERRFEGLLEASKNLLEIIQRPFKGMLKAPTSFSKASTGALRIFKSLEKVYHDAR